MFILYVHDDAGGILVLNKAVSILHEALEKIRKECEPVSLSQLLDPHQQCNEPVRYALPCLQLESRATPPRKGHGPLFPGSRAPNSRVTGPFPSKGALLENESMVWERRSRASLQTRPKPTALQRDSGKAHSGPHFPSFPLSCPHKLSV